MIDGRPRGPAATASYDPAAAALRSACRLGPRSSTTAGHRRGVAAFLADLGVEVAARGAAAFVRYCVDWSEQRHHLSGALGRGLLDRLLELDWIRRSDAGRAVRVTDAGAEGLRATFDIDARYSRA